MLNQVTMEKMQRMRLFGMAEALARPERTGATTDLSFEERLGLLIDAEWETREGRKLTNRLRQARLRYPASLEDVDYAPRRNLDKKVVLALGTCEWIRQKQNVVITGAAGTGKSYLTCALVERACRSGFSAAYVRSARLMHDLAVARGDGSYRRLLVKLAKRHEHGLDRIGNREAGGTFGVDGVEVLRAAAEECCGGPRWLRSRAPRRDERSMPAGPSGRARRGAPSRIRCCRARSRSRKARLRRG